MGRACKHGNGGDPVAGDYELEYTEKDLRLMIAAENPSYATWLAARNITPLYPAPVVTTPIYLYPICPMSGVTVNTRNGRQGEVHLLMHNGQYRVFVNGTGLPFKAVEYYTPQHLRELNPGLAGRI